MYFPFVTHKFSLWEIPTKVINSKLWTLVNTFLRVLPETVHQNRKHFKRREMLLTYLSHSTVGPLRKLGEIFNENVFHQIQVFHKQQRIVTPIDSDHRLILVLVVRFVETVSGRNFSKQNILEIADKWKRLWPFDATSSPVLQFRQGIIIQQDKYRTD